MAKMIKFDLLSKVKTFEELQDSLHADLLGYLKTGKLAKWFLSRELEDKAEMTHLPVVVPPALSINWSGKDFSGRHFDGEDLRNANLEGINLTGASLKDANLSGANLKNAILDNTIFSGANLSNANLKGARIHQADFSYSGQRAAEELAMRIGKTLEELEELFGSMPEEEFYNTDIGKMFFSILLERKTNINNANFSKVIGDRVDFSDSDLTNANFNNARLKNCDFSQSDLTNTNFEGADLEGSNFSSSNFSDTNFTRANLENSRITLDNDDAVVNEDFRKLMLSKLIRTNFSFANLTGAKIDKKSKMCEWEDVKLTGAIGYKG